MVSALVANTVRPPLPPPLAPAAVRPVTGTQVGSEGPADTVPVTARARLRKAARLRRAKAPRAVRVPARVGPGPTPVEPRPMVQARAARPAGSTRLLPGVVRVITGGGQVVAPTPMVVVGPSAGVSTLPERPA